MERRWREEERRERDRKKRGEGGRGRKYRLLGIKKGILEDGMKGGGNGVRKRRKVNREGEKRGKGRKVRESSNGKEKDMVSKEG